MSSLIVIFGHTINFHLTISVLEERFIPCKCIAGTLLAKITLKQKLWIFFGKVTNVIFFLKTGISRNLSILGIWNSYQSILKITSRFQIFHKKYSISFKITKFVSTPGITEGSIILKLFSLDTAFLKTFIFQFSFWYYF